MKKFVFIFLIFVTNLITAGRQDSLLKLVSTQKVDTHYVFLLSEIGDSYENQGDYDKAIFYSLRTRKMADSLHYNLALQSALNTLGISYLDKGDVKNSLEAHLACLKVREQMNSKFGIASSYLNLGNVYFRLGDDDKAINNYEHAIALMYEMKDTLNATIGLTNMGSIYSNKGNVKKAQELYLTALAIRKRYNDLDGIAQIYSNLSVICMDAKKYKEALEYAFETITLYGENGDKLGKAITYSNIGDTYEHMNDLNNAIKYQEMALNLSIEMESTFMLETCYQLLASAYAKKNDFENAVKYTELFSQVRDSTMSSENGKMIAEMQARFETGKKEKEIQLLQTDKSIRELQLSKQESSINRQRIVIYSVIGGLLLMVFLIIFILKEYRQKRKIQLGLEKKNLEISIQKDQIEEKNRLITDSIDYAKNIQTAILPTDDIIKVNFPESFIVFEPKDVVSGDFYWLSEIKDTVLFATVDCAGDGVPGAFMSIVAYNMLENISLEKKLIDPALILNELNKNIQEKAKSQKATRSIQYEMDISLIAFNSKKNELQFAGTKVPLVIVGNSQVNKIIPESGKTQTIPFQKGDMVYMFTDGVGGAEFLEELTAISKKDLQQQKEILQQSVKNATDDVVVVGIRV